jgi:uncharacterized protein (DUF4213/DUF364 family)
MIIEETYNLLKSRYQNQFEGLLISEARIGIYLTAVGLSDGSIGTSATLSGDQPFCAKNRRDFGDFTPLKIKGQGVMDILESEKASSTMLSLRMAVLNAISSKYISAGTYNIIEDKDPIQLVDLDSRKTITVVGAFHSYIRKISETGNKLSVLEMNEGALPEEYKKYFVPAGEYKSVLSSSDIVIITGQTLVNETIDMLLEAITPGTQVIVTGPSGNILPDILFENKVSITGAVRITKPEVLFDIVSEGGTGFHLFEYCARKICILKRNEGQLE